ncbi:MAG: DNA methyltransferase Dim-2 [Trizodia sp. TS-e1964]|nr:MAG: DNA methyltransferase Dim-2 [Trizodia sp. TS-e1964]
MPPEEWQSSDDELAIVSSSKKSSDVVDLITEDDDTQSCSDEYPSARKASYTIPRRLFRQDLISPSVTPSELGDDASQNNFSSASIGFSPKPQKANQCFEVRIPASNFPKSLFDGWTPPTQASDERRLLKSLARKSREQQSDSSDSESESTNEPKADGADFTSYLLDDFYIYRSDTGLHPNELTGLQNLCTKPSNNSYYFDGFITIGKDRKYLQKAAFRTLSIGNYVDTTVHSVGDQVWIQSVHGKNHDIWYQLGKPAPTYAECHNQFLWLANFSKHFIDFLHNHEQVTLHHFREKFYEWIMQLHSQDPEFRAWLKEFDHTDFRRVIAAHPDFLWKEAIDVNELNVVHPIWDEAHHKSLRAVTPQEIEEQRTIVTPFVYECFNKMPWARHMKKISPNPKVLQMRRLREQALHLAVDEEDATSKWRPVADGTSPAKMTPFRTRAKSQVGKDGLLMLDEFFNDDIPESQSEPTMSRRASIARERLDLKLDAAKGKFVGSVLPSSSRLLRDLNGKIISKPPSSIEIGDVVGVPSDQETKWKSKTEMWFAYVQDIHKDKRGGLELKVIWLYAPSDTSCAQMYYPIHNELFFSDNCNCEDGVLNSKDVICKVSVEMFASPNEARGAEYIVRQKFRTNDSAFVTLKKSDFKCVHYSDEWRSDLETVMSKFSKGDTILHLKKLAKGKAILEPAQIVEFRNEGAVEKVVVRRLRRRSRDYPDGGGNIRPNEFVYTDELYEIPPKYIDRRCLVRFYTETEKAERKIPPPYNRDGTGDAYYITCREVDGMLEPMAAPYPATLIQGFDPNAPPEKPVLAGMDLFCGGGNFGRGLEEGGAIHNKWAVDFFQPAIHTYRANLKDPEGTNLFYGSVNDLLARGMRGQFSKCVPEPGNVDFISAGSPCQGFSNANQNKKSENSLRNISLVASVASYVDFYRPKYALLENVTGMANRDPKAQDKNVFAQLLCALVGMGYQVQQFNIDSWSFGSPQSRSRLFVSVAAPGYELPDHPPLSHSHPDAKGESGLGVGANGLSFGNRRFEATPFVFVTAHEGTKDLPDIGNSRYQTCIQHPDHRTSRYESLHKQFLIQYVPKAPLRQTFMTAFARGRMGQLQIDNFRWGNQHKATDKAKCWQRIDPNGLLPTITTAAQPSCAFTGSIVHWNQNRLLSIMEARRAQSFPDEEVLLGLPAKQWKIVGNSVARTVSLALGLSLRGAWLKNKMESPRKMAISMQTKVDNSPRVTFRRSISVEDRTEDDSDVEMTIPRPVTQFPPNIFAKPSPEGSLLTKRKFGADFLESGSIDTVVKKAKVSGTSTPREASPFPLEKSVPVQMDESDDATDIKICFPAEKLHLLNTSRAILNGASPQSFSSKPATSDDAKSFQRKISQRKASLTKISYTQTTIHQAWLSKTTKEEVANHSIVISDDEDVVIDDELAGEKMQVDLLPSDHTSVDESGQLQRRAISISTTASAGDAAISLDTSISSAKVNNNIKTIKIDTSYRSATAAVMENSAITPKANPSFAAPARRFSTSALTPSTNPKPVSRPAGGSAGANASFQRPHQKREAYRRSLEEGSVLSNYLAAHQVNQEEADARSGIPDPPVVAVIEGNRVRYELA